MQIILPALPPKGHLGFCLVHKKDTSVTLWRRSLRVKMFFIVIHAIKHLSCDEANVRQDGGDFNLLKQLLQRFSFHSFVLYLFVVLDDLRNHTKDFIVLPVWVALSVVFSGIWRWPGTGLSDMRVGSLNPRPRSLTLNHDRCGVKKKKKANKKNKML